MKSTREFKTQDVDGNEVTYEFRRPSQGIISKGELIQKAKYSEALRAGVVVAAEVFKLLKSREMWTNEDEAKSRKLREEIRSLEEKFKDLGLSNDDGKKIVDEVRDKRVELMQHEAVIRQVTDATCENIGIEERNMFYAAECTYNKTTGQRVYKSLEDFKSRLNEVATAIAYAEATIGSLEIMSGQDLPSDLSSEYAENKWLAERGLDGKAEEGEPAEEPEKKRSKKKRAKKSTS